MMEVLMRTTLDIDPKALEEIVALTGEKSKGRAVNKVLADYIRRKRLEELLGMLGKVDLDLDDWYRFRHMER